MGKWHKVEKPLDIPSYIEWLAEERAVLITEAIEYHYERVTPRMAYRFETSPFWVEWLDSISEYNDEYKGYKGYPLLSKLDKPELKIKPWESFFDKTHRKNVIMNPNWPKAPPGDWILPNNWYSRINDIIRTRIVVKYLDGAEFLVNKTNLLCKKHNKEDVQCDFEAKEEGYYAVHMYAAEEFEISRIDLDTEMVTTKIEIQVITQTQEVIVDLLRKYYEEKRSKIIPPSKRKWQWEYESPEFNTYYLGHILHYMEGKIMVAREEERSHGKD